MDQIMPASTASYLKAATGETTIWFVTIHQC